MCIRDSCVGDRDHRGARVGIRQQRQALRRAGREAVEENGPCLLYTSDAADERSSVDLGGRRIIKKKR